MFAEIVLPLPKRTLFSYRIPGELEAACRPGMAVLVPVAQHLSAGIVWAVAQAPAWAGGEVRDIVDVLGDAPVLDAPLRDMLDWMARYYLRPIGSVATVALPPFLRHQRRRRVRAQEAWSQVKPRQRQVMLAELPEGLQALAAQVTRYRQGLGEETLARTHGWRGLDRQLRRLEALGVVTVEEQWLTASVGALPAFAEAAVSSPPLAPPCPTPEQQVAMAALEDALARGGYAPFLLHGVTGSGKTEVYFRGVQACLAQGRQALILVPEITLTPQLAGRFQQRFGAAAAVFHSALPPARRRRDWEAVRDGTVRVVIGARSALFAPLTELGLLVVDEEHDASFKQDDKVPYNARDMAVVRARQAGATLVLGSATPSLESWRNAETGRYRLLTLHTRATGAALPAVTVVDLSRPEVRSSLGRDGLITLPLRRALQETLEAGQQALLFLNRRGFAPALLCRYCGHTLVCPNCSVAMTFHRRRGRLLCHYCDHWIAPPDLCPQCGQMGMEHFGPGCERLEAETRDSFPQARVARLDRDVAVTREGGEEVLAAFLAGEVDILVGTQMVAKGHHFPNLALVGIVLAETGLSLPDFRAAERTFQQVVQVAGRAGRERVPGRVVIQSHAPGHYALASALAQDYVGFVAQETGFRSDAGYPPYCHLGLLRYSCLEREEGERFGQQLVAGVEAFAADVICLGPAPAPVERLRNRWRWQLLIKEREGGRWHRGMAGVLALAESLASHRLRVELDVDPQSFF
ncbi:MAG: primosomal protein N' [Magnetococcus sp. WYHC-3]